MKPWYHPDNKNLLTALRQLERKQKYGHLTKGGLHEIWRLKEQLGIGGYKCTTPAKPTEQTED